MRWDEMRLNEIKVLLTILTFSFFPQSLLTLLSKIHKFHILSYSVTVTLKSLFFFFKTQTIFYCCSHSLNLSIYFRLRKKLLLKSKILNNVFCCWAVRVVLRFWRFILGKCRYSCCCWRLFICEEKIVC